ncbi:MAG: 30S ribosomal protein S8e [Candidatus Heimdallarchaeota archaeon]|nr:30S ribosomal protein S8e [Candidatus Heimdallarchaeota archaeon]
MTTFQAKRGRKFTGGRMVSNTEKKKRELGRAAALTTITKTDEIRKKKISGMGNTYKFKLYRSNTINVTVPSTGKTEVATIQDVNENNASKEFRRRDIITKGAILKTSVGDVKVTNRPGQEGHINGILLE